MIDRFRRWLNRPLAGSARARYRLLAGAGLILIVGAAALLALDDDPAPERARAQLPAPTPTPTPTLSPSVEIADLPVEPPSEEGDPAAARTATPEIIQEVKRVAREFMGGYLAFQYGHAPASAIPASTAALRRKLAEFPPRIKPEWTQLRPRIVHMQTNGVSARAADVSAQIDDGETPVYSVRVVLLRYADGWLVRKTGWD